jgi:hypothetical protein
MKKKKTTRGRYKQYDPDVKIPISSQNVLLKKKFSTINKSKNQWRKT